MPKKIQTPGYYQSSLLLRAVPSVILLIMTLLTMVKLPIPFAENANPFFAIIAIFYLTIWQPQFLSIWIAFFAGFIFDIYQSILPLGSYCLLFLIFRQLISILYKQNIFTTNILIMWWRFIQFSIMFFICEWLLALSFSGYNIYSSEYLWRCFTTIIIYPLIHKMLFSIITFVQKKF